MLKRVGIVYHPKITLAKELVQTLTREADLSRVDCWRSSIWDEDDIKSQVAGTDLIISVGGDGTILRAAHAIIPLAVPIFGINVGRVGFMAEVRPNEVLERLPAVLAGDGWIEERMMLQAEVRPNGPETLTFHALNDVVVGRGAIARLVHLKTSIDGEFLTTYKADGLIIASPTGSTSYALAAGGPIMHPELKQVLLQPISAHLSLDKALVVPATAIVELEVLTDHQAMVSIDGQVDRPLESGDVIRVKQSPHTARFLRMGPQTHFYASLTQRLKQTE